MVRAAARNRDRLMVAAIVRELSAPPAPRAPGGAPGLIRYLDAAGNCTRADYFRTTTDRIVSWSRINGKLTRNAWRSNKSILEHESKTVVD